MANQKITELEAKTTPIDADVVVVVDTADTAMSVDGTNKKLTWANIKATLKTYFDTLYVALTGNQTIAGIKTFSSFPVTPESAPATDYQVANKKYVDDNGGGGWELLDTWTYSTDVSSFDLFAGPGVYKELLLVPALVRGGNCSIQLVVSDDDGATFLGAGKYSRVSGSYVDALMTWQSINTVPLFFPLFLYNLPNFFSGTKPIAQSIGNGSSNSAQISFDTTLPINAIRIIAGSGIFFTGGSVRLYGR